MDSFFYVFHRNPIWLRANSLPKVGCAKHHSAEGRGLGVLSIIPRRAEGHTGNGGYFPQLVFDCLGFLLNGARSLTEKIKRRHKWIIFHGFSIEIRFGYMQTPCSCRIMPTIIIKNRWCHDNDYNKFDGAMTTIITNSMVP